MKCEATTTVRGKLHVFTIRKPNLLDGEYDAFQTAVHGGDFDLYLAIAQQAS